MQIVRDAFAAVESIRGVTTQNDTASSFTVNGRSITVICMSGDLWINPLGTAVANTTSIKLEAGMSFDLIVDEDLSLISDGTGADYQIITYRL